jgi:hypothetical protein
VPRAAGPPESIATSSAGPPPKSCPYHVSTPTQPSAPVSKPTQMPEDLRHITSIHIVSHCKNYCCYRQSDGKKHWAVARLFYDETRTNCDGRSANIQYTILRWRLTNFEMLIGWVKQFLRRHRRGAATICFYCNRGKHRSVACACLFAQIFSMLDVPCTVEHRSLEHHEQACNCPTCNAEPLQESKELKKLFLDAEA